MVNESLTQSLRQPERQSPTACPPSAFSPSAALSFPGKSPVNRGRPYPEAARPSSRRGLQQPIAHTNDDAFPVAKRRLPKQLRGRVPGAVVAIPHPAKIRRIGKQDHDRLAQRSRQMRNRGIDRYHDIEQRNDGGGIGEIAQSPAEMNEIRQASQQFAIRAAQIALETETRDRRILEQCRQTRERNRSVSVVLVRWLSRPDKTGARTLRRQTIPPILHPLRRRGEIWNGRRNRLHSRSERERKAKQGTMQVVGRKRLTGSDHCN